MGNSCRCIKQPCKDPFASPEQPATPCHECSTSKKSSVFFLKNEATFSPKIKKNFRALNGVSQRYERKRFQLWKPWQAGVVAIRHETKEDASPCWFLSSESQNASLLGDTIERDLIAKKRPDAGLGNYTTLTATTTCSTAQRGETDTTTVSVCVTEEEKEDDVDEAVEEIQLKCFSPVDAPSVFPLTSDPQQPSEEDTEHFLLSDVPPHDINWHSSEHQNVQNVLALEQCVTDQSESCHPEDNSEQRSVPAPCLAINVENKLPSHSAEPAANFVNLKPLAPNNVAFAKTEETPSTKMSPIGNGNPTFPNTVLRHSVCEEHDTLRRTLMEERSVASSKAQSAKSTNVDFECEKRKFFSHALLQAKRQHPLATSKTRKESKSRKTKARIKSQAAPTVSIAQKTTHIGKTGEHYSSLARRRRRPHNSTLHKPREVSRTASSEQKKLPHTAVEEMSALDKCEIKTSAAVSLDTVFLKKYAAPDYPQFTTETTARFPVLSKTDTVPCFDFLPSDSSGATRRAPSLAAPIITTPPTSFPCSRQLASAATASELQEFFCCSPGSSRNPSCDSPNCSHHRISSHKTSNFESSTLIKQYNDPEPQNDRRIQLPKFGLDLKKLCFLEQNASSQRPCTDRPQPQRIVFSPGWVATARRPKERDVRAVNCGSSATRLPLLREPMTDRPLGKCSNGIPLKTYRSLCARPLVTRSLTSCSDNVPILSGTQRSNNAIPAASIVRYA